MALLLVTLHLILATALAEEGLVENSTAGNPGTTADHFSSVLDRLLQNVTKEGHGEKSAKPTDSLVKTINTSSVQVYIIVLIGIVPATIGALFYCLANLNRKRKRRERTSRRKSFSAVVSICNANQSEVRQLRYYGNNNAAGGTFDADHKDVKQLDGNYTGMIRRRRVYSIEYPRKNLELLELLGEGNFGLVWKARVGTIRQTGVVAVKTAKAESNEKEWSDLLQELNIMLQLGHHPNVVRLLGCCTETVPYYLIMEYVENGKLLSFLREYRTKQDYYNENKISVTTFDLLTFAYQAAKGMEFISSYGIIHRDLAARNVLVDKSKNCKIADFGLARSVRDREQDVYEQKTKGAMPIRWMAPESLYLNLFTTKADVWSYGILLWEIITLGSTPYPGLSASDVVKNVKEGLVMEMPEVVWCSDRYYSLMQECWNMDPLKRPTFSKLKEKVSRLLELHKDYVHLSDFSNNFYYNIMYKSPGEKV